STGVAASRDAQSRPDRRMTFTLLVLAALMAAIVGWLLRQTLNTAPWQPRAADEAGSGSSFDVAGTRVLGLATFLAVVTSLFALFISAYLMRRHMHDWTDVSEPDILWLNTALLVAASLVYQ